MHKREILIIEGFSGDMDFPEPDAIVAATMQEIMDAEMVIVVNDLGEGKVIKMRNDFPEEFVVRSVLV